MSRNLKLTLATLCATLAAAWFITTATELAASAFGIELPAQHSLDVILSARGQRLAWLVAYVVVLAPLAEEAVFRLLLFKGPLSVVRLIMRKPAPTAAAVSVAIVSSALFSATHYIEMPFPDNAFAALFTFGLITCWLYRKTGSIRHPILLHILFNGANLAFAFAFPELAK